ncbi:UNVERIFIED_CONTAM: hypothetical protein O8I53_13680 [Campylobacter lari]
MKKIKLFKLGLIASSPVLLAPVLSASCLEQINAILNKNRPGKKDDTNTNTTKPTPVEGSAEPSTKPNENQDDTPKRTQLEMINDFKDIYNDRDQLDTAPLIFNEPGILIGRLEEERLSEKFKKIVMFKHITQLKYSGNKKFYDYVLQADNFKERLENRLLKLFDKDTSHIYLNNYKTIRFGKQ